MKRQGFTASLLVLTLLATTATADRIVHTERSLYRNIAVTDDDNIRCLTFTARRRNTRQSCIDLEDPNKLVLPYLPMVFTGLAINPRPESVLIIGLGGGTISEVFSSLYPGIEIDAVEIDEAVVNVARKHFNYREKPGANVHVRDGRVFVRRATRARKQYDYIVLDAFNGDYIPEHLMTAEFLRECQALLTENGVLVANTFSSSRLYDSESQTYASVFDHFLNLRRRGSNRVIVAAADGRELDPDALREAIPAIPADLDRFGIDLYTILSMHREHDWRKRARVLTDDYSPANLLQGRGDD